MASPVGVPLPSALVAATAAFTLLALAAATGTSMLLVTNPLAHELPSPSGNVFIPQDTAVLVSVITCVIAGRTMSHLVGPVVPLGGSSMERERSSTRSSSAGLRTRLKWCSPHALGSVAPASLLGVGVMLPPMPVPSPGSNVPPVPLATTPLAPPVPSPPPPPLSVSSPPAPRLAGAAPPSNRRRLR